jgi:hypothetical protein
MSPANPTPAICCTGGPDCAWSTTITETTNTYGHLFPDAEDLSRGTIDAIFAVALTEQNGTRRSGDRSVPGQ